MGFLRFPGNPIVERKEQLIFEEKIAGPVRHEVCETIALFFSRRIRVTISHSIRIIGSLALALAVTLALLGSISPAAVKAAHLTRGDILTTDTTLDDDLLNCPAHGLEILAGGITLDCAGLTITGPGARSNPVGPRFAEVLARADNVTVRGCKLSDYASFFCRQVATAVRQY